MFNCLKVNWKAHEIAVGYCGMQFLSEKNDKVCCLWLSSVNRFRESETSILSRLSGNGGKPIWVGYVDYSSLIWPHWWLVMGQIIPILGPKICLGNARWLYIQLCTYKLSSQLETSIGLLCLVTLEGIPLYKYYESLLRIITLTILNHY